MRACVFVLSELGFGVGLCEKLDEDTAAGVSDTIDKYKRPPYREIIDIDNNSVASPNSFHSVDDGGERDGNQSTQDDMILSNSIVNLNMKKICDISSLT